MAEPARKRKQKGLRALQGGKKQSLDPMIHEPKRLAILSALSVNEKLTFNDLKALLETTDGNLSIHCKKLEEAGYLKVRKTFEGRIPRTIYSLRAGGRRAFDDYLNHLEAIIKNARDV